MYYSFVETLGKGEARQGIGVFVEVNLECSSLPTRNVAHCIATRGQVLPKDENPSVFHKSEETWTDLRPKSFTSYKQKACEWIIANPFPDKHLK